MPYVYDSMSKRVCCARVCTSVCLSQTHITSHSLLTHNYKSNTPMQYKIPGVMGLTNLVYTAVEQEADPNKLEFEDH